MPTIRNVTLTVTNNSAQAFTIRGDVSTTYGAHVSTYAVANVTAMAGGGPRNLRGTISATLTGRVPQNYTSITVQHTAANPRLGITELYTLTCRT